MIQGNVVGRQARISIILRLPENLDREIECVVDTGFEGFLTLPSSAIALSKPERTAIEYSREEARPPISRTR